MNDVNLSALAVESIELAAIQSGIAAMRKGGAAVCEVARAFGVDDATVRKAARR